MKIFAFLIFSFLACFTSYAEYTEYNFSEPNDKPAPVLIFSGKVEDRADDYYLQNLTVQKSGYRLKEETEDSWLFERI